MFTKILIALFLAVALYVLYLFFTTPKSWSDNETFAPEMPAVSPPVEQQARVEPPRVISPSGPNPPNAQAGEESPPPEVTARDPYDDPNSSGNLKDNLRHPERVFSPGVAPRDTGMGVMSGVASNASAVTSQAVQVFAPESAQNGGEFMHGIAANDTTGEAEYAAF